MENYDSREETSAHIKRVGDLLETGIAELTKRAEVHDKSKLEEPEKSLFDKMTPILKNLKYGSEEYKESLKELQVALDHHYSNNSHHPQYYSNGINGMNLFDIIEMFYDWKAATERTSNGSLEESIVINAKRFNMSPQLVDIFENTRKYLKY